MNAPTRRGSLVAAVFMMCVLSLGAIWLRDRTRHWERATWRAEDFVRLRGGAEAMPTWIMPINPRCSHCMATLATVHASWERRGSCPLTILIVDTPTRPRRSLLATIPPTEVWWDRTGVWRRRWGHRLYGELIRFDDRGAMVETVHAQVLLTRLLTRPRARCGASEDAPAEPQATDPEKGGT